MHRSYVALSLCGFLLACPRLDGRQSRDARGIRQEAAAPPWRWNAHVRLLRDGVPGAARVRVVGSDGKSHAPAGAALRETKRGDPYFYAEGAFDVELPPGRVRMNVSGGLETIPQTLAVDAEAATD